MTITAPTPANPMTPEPSEYTLTSRDAARLLGVDQSTVARWSREGKIPCLVTRGGLRGPGHRRYRIADIDALARQMQRGQGEER